MTGSRIEIVGQKEFVPREWLRREMLWASMMAPYSVQIDGWKNGIAIAQHLGNVSRRDLFARSGDEAEYQANSFFNQGKNIAGLLNSVSLFKVMMSGGNEALSPINIQASILDKALGNLGNNRVVSLDADSESQVYQECTDAVVAADSNPNQFGNKQRLVRASKAMSGLAMNELSSWVEVSSQDSLDKLIIPDGGTARSVGPRVEMLQPLFNQIIASDDYLSLS